MIKTDGKNGWLWHFKVYNYLTREMNVYNAPMASATFDLAFKDMVKFIRKLKVKDEEKTKTPES